MDVTIILSRLLWIGEISLFEEKELQQLVLPCILSLIYDITPNDNVYKQLVNDLSLEFEQNAKKWLKWYQSERRKIVFSFLSQREEGEDWHLHFRNASMMGWLEIVRLLIRVVDPSIQDNHAIRRASLLGCVNIVQLLLEDNRVDPTAKENEALRFAIRYRQSGVVRLLLQDDRIHLTPSILYQSLEEINDSEMVNLLINHQSVNITTHLANSLIHKAIRMGKSNMVRFLLSNPSIKNNLTTETIHLLLLTKNLPIKK